MTLHRMVGHSVRERVPFKDATHLNVFSSLLGWRGGRKDDVFSKGDGTPLICETYGRCDGAKEGRTHRKTLNQSFFVQIVSN